MFPRTAVWKMVRPYQSWSVWPGVTCFRSCHGYTHFPLVMTQSIPEETFKASGWWLGVSDHFTERRLLWLVPLKVNISGSQTFQTVGADLAKHNFYRCIPWTLVQYNVCTLQWLYSQYNGNKWKKKIEGRFIQRILFNVKCSETQVSGHFSSRLEWD